MAAETYFRTAAAELRKAIAEKRHDIDMLKKQLTDQETQAKQTIDQLQKDKLNKQRGSGLSNLDDHMRAELQKQAQHDLSQVTDIEHSIRKQKDMMQKQITATERDIMDLEQKARALETRT